MDLVRSCYKTKVRFFKDSDIEVSIRWFFCNPTAKLLGIYSRFSSGNWASQRDSWPGPGEVLGASREWSDGETPQWAIGQRHCGTGAQWADGPVFDPSFNAGIQPSGQPLCCGKDTGPTLPCPVCSGFARAIYYFHLESATGSYSALPVEYTFTFSSSGSFFCVWNDLTFDEMELRANGTIPTFFHLVRASIWFGGKAATGADCVNEVFRWDVSDDLGTFHARIDLFPP